MNDLISVDDDVARLLLEAYVKVLRIDLTNDSFEEIKLSWREVSAHHGYSSSISKWLKGFARTGNVYPDDTQAFLGFSNLTNLLTEFDSGRESVSLRYRRRNDEGDFRWVRMTIRKASDYSDTNRVAMLYIEDIHDDVMAAQELSERRREITLQQQELAEQRQEITDQRQEITDQQQEITEQRGITGALVDMYFTCLFVDMDDNSYRRIHVGKDLERWVPETGSMFDTLKVYMEKLVVPDDVDEFLKNFSVEMVREKLADQNSYDYEYWAKITDRSLAGSVSAGDGSAFDEAGHIWCRISAVLVDRHADGSPRHIVIGMQDVTFQAESVARTNAMLKDAFDSAMAANSAKSEFMSRMSHDIRTPLNGIIGMTAIAGVHLDDRERVADCLTKITGAGKHLLSLINDILDLSKIESGKVSLSNAEFKLPTLMDELISMVHTAVNERGHDLRVYIRNVEHEDVVGDDVRLQQVFTNIVSNAIKYTPDGGKIDITLEELPLESANVGQYRFTCKDNGRGMSEEFLKRVFEPFERADGADASQIQGTGLGMTIARNIVNMMGGNIFVESQEGVGTRFTVDFKLKLQEETGVLTNELLDLPVLVVDDDEVTCESACIMLGELGMKPDYSLSGEEAVDRVAALHTVGKDYFACLIDWKMPGIDGIETTRRIRRVVGPDVPIIIISAYEWTDIEDEARLAGADAFIAKPLFKSRLRATFTELPKTLKSAAGTRQLEGFIERDFTGKRLLLVEDNELNREIASEILQMTGATVETAEDGRIAVDKFAASEPGYYAMVFMDVRMPVMDGYEATRAIRMLDRADAAAVPIVALTANAFMEDVERASEAGMNAHMAKPIDYEKLLAVMEDCLGAD